ncbi:four helix bundle protein [Bacteroidota bacterium]
MASVNKFEDLEVWKKARLLCLEIHVIADKECFNRDYGLIKQIKRSSGSIMDNIAEGFERNGNNEFIQYLSISKGSAGEVRSQLYRALDNKYINKETFDILYAESEEVSKMIGGLIKYLKNTSFKGVKFNNRN